MLSHISISEVRNHYLDRKRTHSKLLRLFKHKQIKDYVYLALGITDNTGNYSADEHSLGPRILNENSIDRVYQLATELYSCQSPNHLPNIIYKSKLPFLKISVGSEMAMMLRPNDFWVGNVRTIWANLWIKHNFDYDKADEELKLYRDSDRTSAMDYQIWRDIYLSLQHTLDYLSTEGNKEAKKNKIKPGKLKYLWGDAIASSLYADEYD